jgi:Tol biopolymer transport system component
MIKRRSRARGLVSVMIGAGALVAIVVPAAQATFPGQNGRIAVTFNGSFGAGGYAGYFVAMPYQRWSSGSFGSWGIACSVSLGQQNDCGPGAGVSFNATGSVAAFGASNGTQNVIGLVAANGSKLTLLPAQTPNDQQPAFTPGSSASAATIAFEGQSSPGHTDVYALKLNMAMKPATVSGITQVTHYGDATSPAWGLNNRIAFTHAGNLYAIDASGKGLQQLTRTGGSQASWSPHASTIAFERGGQVWRMNVGSTGAGTHATQLTRNGGAWPAWSPDATAIAFERNPCSSAADDCQPTIFTMSATGTNPRTPFNAKALGNQGDGIFFGPGGIAWQPLPNVSLSL